mgnify:FL=1
MKVKLFISTSLGLAGLWLVAAYFHTVDLASYTPTITEPAPAVVELPEAPVADDKTSVAAQ